MRSRLADLSYVCKHWWNVLNPNADRGGDKVWESLTKILFHVEERDPLPKAGQGDSYYTFTPIHNTTSSSALLCTYE